MSSSPFLSVVFFRTALGREPVREWLKGLDKSDRKVIGEDIKLVQFRWPLGMPLVRKLEADLWEVRSHLSGGRVARVLFTEHEGQMACSTPSLRNLEILHLMTYNSLGGEALFGLTGKRYEQVYGQQFR